MTCGFTITPEDIEAYLIKIEIADDWVSFRHPDYPASSASKRANRYNHDGDTAYYLASGYDVAKSEVPNWQELNAYKVAPSTIHAFNLAQWSKDNGLYGDFLKSKEHSGHGLCQQATDQLTGVHGVSGILYNSEPMFAQGKTGCCLVILPQSGQMVSDKFFAQDYGFTG
jgi:hypothetical protein